MSRRGNRHDNAVAAKSRVEAWQDVFDHVEMFYNAVRKQIRNGALSPVAFER